MHAMRIEVLHPERLETLRKILLTKSVIWYANHYARLEPFTHIRTVAENVTSLDRTAGTVDKKHLSKDRGRINRFQASVIHGWEETFGGQAIPMVKEDDQHESASTRTSINKSSLDTIQSILTVPGNIVLISPEGDRSPKKQLMEAKRGLELIFWRSQDTAVAIPVASEYHSVIPFGPPTIINPGEFFTYEQIKAQLESYPGLTITDLMMVRLANLINPRCWGYYQEIFYRHPELAKPDEFAGVEKFY